MLQTYYANGWDVIMPVVNSVSSDGKPTIHVIGFVAVKLNPVPNGNGGTFSGTVVGWVDNGGSVTGGTVTPTLPQLQQVSLIQRPRRRWPGEGPPSRRDRRVRARGALIDESAANAT